MWKRPPVSIALLTHNRCGYLDAALEAILGQTFGDFELLVLDNDSTDATAEALLRRRDSRLVYVRQPPGHLSGYNWASALWMARGDRVLITHDDDLMERELLARQMEACEGDPGLVAVASNVSLIDPEGTLLQPSLYAWPEDRLFPPGALLPAFVEEKLWVPMQTCLFRRETLARRVGLHRRWQPVRRLTTLATGDILNALLLNRAGAFRILKEPLLRYRQHGQQEGRGVDPSSHMIELFRLLLRRGVSDPWVGPHRSLLRVRMARYQAQDLVNRMASAKDLPRLRRQVARLVRGLDEGGLLPPACQALAAPLDVFARLLDLPGIEAWDAEARGQNSSATRAFLAWRRRLAEGGRGLFPREGGPRRIAILGSLFAAGLIALDALRSGVEVVCFLDSSPVRQGQQMLDRRVFPPSWLAGHPAEVDAVVISSEGESEESVRRMLRAHRPDPGLPLPSWKDLALEEGLGKGEAR
jgi:glycosyltransferase involved in cell wall biosynthesis